MIIVGVHVYVYIYDKVTKIYPIHSFLTRLLILLNQLHPLKWLICFLVVVFLFLFFLYIFSLVALPRTCSFSTDYLKGPRKPAIKLSSRLNFITITTENHIEELIKSQRKFKS